MNHFYLIVILFGILSCEQDKITSKNNKPQVIDTLTKTKEVTDIKAQIKTDSLKKEKSKTIKESGTKKEFEYFKGIKWNYKGTIGDIPIRAFLEWQEAYHMPGSGAIQMPFTGYYFYESSKIKILLEGSMNGVGMFYMNTTNPKNKEDFSGQSEFNSIEGTWTKGDKSLPFKLLDISSN